MTFFKQDKIVVCYFTDSTLVDFQWKQKVYYIAGSEKQAKQADIYEGSFIDFFEDIKIVDYWFKDSLCAVSTAGGQLKDKPVYIKEENLYTTLRKLSPGVITTVFSQDEQKRTKAKIYISEKGHGSMDVKIKAICARICLSQKGSLALSDIEINVFCENNKSQSIQIFGAAEQLGSIMECALEREHDCLLQCARSLLPEITQDEKEIYFINQALNDLQKTLEGKKFANIKAIFCAPIQDGKISIRSLLCFAGHKDFLYLALQAPLYDLRKIQNLEVLLSSCILFNEADDFEIAERCLALRNFLLRCNSTDDIPAGVMYTFYCLINGNIRFDDKGHPICNTKVIDIASSITSVTNNGGNMAQREGFVIASIRSVFEDTIIEQFGGGKKDLKEIGEFLRRKVLQAYIPDSHAASSASSSSMTR